MFIIQTRLNLKRNSKNLIELPQISLHDHKRLNSIAHSVLPVEMRQVPFSQQVEELGGKNGTLLFSRSSALMTRHSRLASRISGVPGSKGNALLLLSSCGT